VPAMDSTYVRHGQSVYITSHGRLALTLSVSPAQSAGTVYWTILSHGIFHLTVSNISSRHFYFVNTRPYSLVWHARDYCRYAV